MLHFSWYMAKNHHMFYSCMWKFSSMIDKHKGANYNLHLFNYRCAQSEMLQFVLRLIAVDAHVWSKNLLQSIKLKRFYILLHREGKHYWTQHNTNVNRVVCTHADRLDFRCSLDPPEQHLVIKPNVQTQKQNTTTTFLWKAPPGMEIPGRWGV